MESSGGRSQVVKKEWQTRKNRYGGEKGWIMKGKGKNDWVELIGIERNHNAFLIVSGKGRVL